MIDFSNCREIVSTYGGSEKKKKIIYEDEAYLLKFPDPIREKDSSLSYMNNQFSEYIGCHIIESLGIPVQETIMGTYKDITDSNNQLIEFSKLANSVTSIDN